MGRITSPHQIATLRLSPTSTERASHAMALPATAPVTGSDAVHGRDLEGQLASAFAVLQYNQELVQFADGKANTLILINSIALASACALNLSPQGSLHDLAVTLRCAFLLFSVASVGLSLAVVLSRLEDSGAPRRRDLIFFADIVSRTSASAFRSEFICLPASQMRDDLLDRAWRVSEIASRKYACYTQAQRVTVVACALWMALLLSVQLLP